MALPTPEQVRGVIQEKVQDPELMMNIVDIGLIYGVEISEVTFLESRNDVARCAG